MKSDAEVSYGLQLANSSFDWYRTAAIRSRRMHRGSEIGTLVLSALVPLAAVLAPGSAIWPALFGSLVVIVGGLRAIFHWQENYLRFSLARESIEAERRKYHAAIGLYAKPDERDSTLVAEITRIEQEEMGIWVSIASPGGKRADE